MRINVQVAPGLAAYETLEQQIVVNHPHDSETGTCKKCEPLNGQPAARVAYPPIHPGCVCTVEWKEVRRD